MAAGMPPRTGNGNGPETPPDPAGPKEPRDPREPDVRDPPPHAPFPDERRRPPRKRDPDKRDAHTRDRRGRLPGRAAAPQHGLPDSRSRRARPHALTSRRAPPACCPRG